MPVIDPERLARQVAELEPLASNPTALTVAVARLVDEYLVRTRSASDAEAAIPGPVHRAVLQALRTSLAEQPDVASRAAAALWRARPAPAQLLAIGLISIFSDVFVPDLAESWAVESTPAALVQELGEVGLTGWRRAHLPEFLERASRWIGDRRLLLSLYGLRAAAQDPEFQDLPAVFQLLDGVGDRVRGESKRAFGQLLRALAHRSPGEATQFLHGQVEAGGRGRAWMKALLSEPAFRSPR